MIVAPGARMRQPWSLFIVFSHHLYAEPLISLLLVMIVSLGLWGYLKGGISRCITVFITSCLLYLVVTVALGVGI